MPGGRHLAGLLIDLGLAAVTAAWTLWFYTLHPAWRERRALVSLFLAGLIALMAVMVLRDPYFGIFTWTGYLYVYLLPLGRWRLLAAAQVESDSGAGTAISACVPAVPAGASPAEPGRGAASPVAASPVEARS